MKCFYRADLLDMWHFKCSSLLLSGVVLGLSGRGRAAMTKERTVFTDFQPLELEKEFRLGPELCHPRRLEMAARLQLTNCRNKIWFQNRRMRHKKEHKYRKLAGSSQWSPCDPFLRSCEDLLSFPHVPKISSSSPELLIMNCTPVFSSVIGSHSDVSSGECTLSAHLHQLSSTLPSVGPPPSLTGVESYHHAGISN